MTNETPKAPPLYPKSHLLAASGIAALLSLALLVFPSSEVEAKKTTLSPELETPAEQLKDESKAAPLVRRERRRLSFAQVEEGEPPTKQAEQQAPATEEKPRRPPRPSCPAIVKSRSRAAIPSPHCSPRLVCQPT